jgi:AP-1 complex subunit beta-1
MFVISDPVIC